MALRRRPRTKRGPFDALRKATLALAAGVALACLPPSRAEAACTVSGATLEHYTDHVASFYLNGNLISTCGACGNAWKTLTTHVFTPAELAWINPAPGDNTLSSTIAETALNVSGGTWKLNITYSGGCPDQEVVSNGFCTRTYYAGLYGLEYYPPGWTTNGFDDSSWGGVYTSTTHENTWLDLNYNAGPVIPWIWGNASFNATQKDVFAFRQKFQLGNPTYCPVAPAPTPTQCPAAPCIPGTPTPVPPPCTIPAISNGNLEMPPVDYISDADSYNNWYFQGWPTSGNCQEKWVTYTARSATHSFLVNVNDVGGAGSCVTQGVSFFQNLGCVNTSCSYTVCGWVMTNWTSGSTGVYIAIEQYDAAGTKLAGGPTVLRGDMYKGITATAWTQFCVTVGGVTPATWLPGMDHIRVALGADTSLIQAYFDDITISQVCGSTPTFTPTRTASPTATRTRTATPSPTASPTPSPTPTLSGTATSTATATQTFSFTSTPSSSPTRTVTESSTPSPTRTATATLTASGTPTPTLTATATRTETPTRTASGTPTPTRTLTETSTETATRTASLTPTSTRTFTSTSTQTATYTASLSPTPTRTFTVTSTQTGTYTPSLSPTPTSTLTSTPTLTSTYTASGTRTSTPTATETATETSLASATSTSTSSITLTVTPSYSETPSYSSTLSASPTFSATPSYSATVSYSATLSASPSSSATPSYSATSSFTPVITATSSSTPGPSATMTLSWTPSQTPLPPPERFKLVSVYPNPIGAVGANFVFSLPRPGTVRFWLYDLRGELIWSGDKEYPAGGNYQYSWPATNNFGAAISYGAYYLQAKAEYGGGGAEKDGKWLTVLR